MEETTKFILTRTGIKKVTGEEHKFQVGEVISGLLGRCFSEANDFIVTEVTTDYLTLVEKGGRNRMEKIEKAFVRPISEKFGIGYYYEDKDMPEYLSTQQIEYYKQKALETAAETKRLLDAKLQAEIDESIRLKLEYPYLEYFPLSKLGQGSFIPHKIVAKNIRQWLKHHFPTEKFSVRMSGFDTIQVTCPNKDIEGPVKLSLLPFKESLVDPYSDSTVRQSTVFNLVFGGTSYLWVN